MAYRRQTSIDRAPFSARRSARIWPCDRTRADSKDDTSIRLIPNSDSEPRSARHAPFFRAGEHRLHRVKRFDHAFHQVVGLTHGGPGGFDRGVLRLERPLEIAHIARDAVAEGRGVDIESFHALFELLQ